MSCEWRNLTPITGGVAQNPDCAMDTQDEGVNTMENKVVGEGRKSQGLISAGMKKKLTAREVINSHRMSIAAAAGKDHADEEGNIDPGASQSPYWFFMSQPGSKSCIFSSPPVANFCIMFSPMHAHRPIASISPS